MPRIHPLSTSIGLAAGLLLSACGGGSSATAVDTPAESADASSEAVLETIAAADAQAIIDSSSGDLVVLDVRTPEEYEEAHLANAILIDFYEEDFSDRLSELDPNAEYVLYCRSGNRSGQTVDMMRQLGFTNVHEVDGGINSWLGAGLPTE